jgi:hypothetical protein
MLKLTMLAGGEKGLTMELAAVPAVDGRERFGSEGVDLSFVRLEFSPR